jgi:hypothetical protein
MSFLSTVFGGPSQSEINAANQESNLAQTYSNAFSQTFGEQQGILNQINQQLTPIANLGPNQQGFSPQELAAMNTGAIDAAGAAARNAKQAAATTLAGEGGGGSSGLVSGVQQQIEGSIDSQAANELAATQNAITQKNYDVGRSNFWNSSSGEQSLASKYNPEAFGNLASSTEQSAFSDQSKVSAENGSLFGDIGKVVGMVAPLITGGLGNLDSTGSSSTGEQFGNFFSGALGLSQPGSSGSGGSSGGGGLSSDTGNGLPGSGNSSEW